MGRAEVTGRGRAGAGGSEGRGQGGHGGSWWPGKVTHSLVKEQYTSWEGGKKCVEGGGREGRTVSLLVGDWRRGGGKPEVVRKLVGFLARVSQPAAAPGTSVRPRPGCSRGKAGREGKEGHLLCQHSTSASPSLPKHSLRAVAGNRNRIWDFEGCRGI
ncbi:hypothetical protein E2C01_030285 [Portunus trituberculatus]|uniref:Uncharacterized protein n=1 Tax=Portunus trituberculatus TaxID=210409 RepID=A0A5B7EUC7_PORTR|nr:hypothetical protein [Portunus trituberculatus]